MMKSVCIQKSLLDLDLKLDSLTQECSVQFVKAFWSLSEHDSFQVLKLAVLTNYHCVLLVRMQLR